MTDLLFAPLTDVQRALESKTVSSEELTKDFLKQIHAFDRLNAYISTFEEEALQQARTADKKRASGDTSPLLGVPLALKDNIVMTEGETTCASNFLKDYQSPFDATCVEKLRNAGAVLLGKTNLDEFSMGSSTENSFFGATSNPWDETRVPGGTSGGSAAAVAAGLATAALGTDTGGSIRQPGAFCSVTGLKPTYGRISRYGIVAFASSLDQVGTMTHTAEDAALLCSLLFGKDPLDATSMDKEVPDFDLSTTKDLKGKTIGIPQEYFTDALSGEIAQVVTAATKEFEKLGATLREISLPNTELAVPTYYIIAPAEASSNLARFDGLRYGTRAKDVYGLKELYAQSRTEGFGKEVKRRILTGAYVLSSGYYDAYYLQALKTRRLIQQDFHTAFEHECDFILSPTTPTTAFQKGENVDDPIAMYLNDIYTVTANLAGLPALNLPCGFDSQGLPIGLQLTGKAWDEELLLKAGMLYQRQTDWHTRRPSLTEGS